MRPDGGVGVSLSYFVHKQGLKLTLRVSRSRNYNNIGVLKTVLRLPRLYYTFELKQVVYK